MKLTQTILKLRAAPSDQAQAPQADIFAGNVKTVIVWKLDRLSRNLRDGENVLADLAEKGLKILVVTQQLELNGVMAKNWDQRKRVPGFQWCGPKLQSLWDPPAPSAS